jgi:DNA-directed RNA polymerase subunit RPC12/RpoP
LYEKAGGYGQEEKRMKATDVKTSAKPVMALFSGSVVVRCNRCGQLISDMFKLNGGTVKCPYCKSQYLYHVKLTAKPAAKTNA